MSPPWPVLPAVLLTGCRLGSPVFRGCQGIPEMGILKIQSPKFSTWQLIQIIKKKKKNLPK